MRELTIAHTEDFMKMGAKGVVIACNTATSAAVRVLRLMYPELPLVGIEPGQYPCDGDTDHDPGRKTASFD